YGHQAVDTEHLLAALLQDKDGIVPRLIGRTKVRPDVLLARLEAALESKPKVSGSGYDANAVYATRALNELLVRAHDEAKQLKDDYVSVEHLVLAAFADRTGAGKVLAEVGLTRDELLKALVEVRGNQRVTSQNPEASYEALEKYGTDLVDRAR